MNTSMRWLLGTLVVAACACPSQAGDRLEPYLAPEGRLKHRLQLTNIGPGEGGLKGRVWTIEPSGEWQVAPFVEGGPEAKSLRKGKLTPRQLEALANHLAAQDLLRLPKQLGSGLPQVPQMITLRFGDKTTTLQYDVDDLAEAAPPPRDPQAAAWSRVIALVFVIEIMTTRAKAEDLGAEPERPGRPEVPERLRPPEESKELFRMEAEGVQIYVSKEGKDGKLVWSPKGPLADLSQNGKRAGYHYAGPSWEAADGSKLVREPKAEVVNAPSPNPAADIPWLRIRVKPEGKAEGTLGGVDYVLRVQTQGGAAPRQAPVRAGTEVGVRYRAVYLFYGPVR